MNLSNPLGEVPKAYGARKRFAVDLAVTLLRETGQPELQSFCPGSKKDDLADALLQAFCV